MKPVKTASVGIAELKARLASYLRLVKGGAEIEVLERGTPIATLRPSKSKSPSDLTPPRRDPGLLARYQFSVHPEKTFDAVALLLEERNRR